MYYLEVPIDAIKGIGLTKAKALDDASIRTVDTICALDGNE